MATTRVIVTSLCNLSRRFGFQQKVFTSSPSNLANHNLKRPWLCIQQRDFAENSADAKGGEDKIKSVLQGVFPSPSKVLVEDISGGCGSMYQIFVESNEFEGLSIVKQHQMVNKALKEEIKDMHGIRIITQAPKR